jgi:MFS family permease
LIIWQTSHSISKQQKSTAVSLQKFALLRDPVFVILATSAFVITALYSQLKTSFPFYLHHYYHFNVQLFSYLYLINTLLIALFQIPVLSSLKNINKNLIVGVGGLLVGLGLFILPFDNTYTLAVISCVLWTFGEILFFSVVQVLMYEQAPQHAKGKAMGVYQMLWAFASMVGPAAGSWLYEFDNGKLVWYLCGFLGLLCLLAFIWVYNRQTMRQIEINI